MASKDQLADFNHAVSDWSGQFAPELQRVARITGNRMGWDHNEFTISWAGLQRHYQAAFNETISLPTLKKHARLWADQGGLKIVPQYRETNGRQLKKDYPNRLGKDGKRVGTRGGYRMNSDSNRFVVDFDVVVKGRRVNTGKRGRPVTEYWAEPWTFGQGITLPPSCSPVAGQLPRTTFNSVITPSLTTSDPGGKETPTDGEVKVGPAVETRAKESGAQPPAQPGDRNTITFWKDGKGRNRIYTGDNLAASPASARRVPGHAKRVSLQPDHAAWMWQRYGKGFPDAQMNFLAMTDALRAQVIAGADNESDRKKEINRAVSKSTRGLLIRVYREQLIGLCVAADQIDRRVAGEWAGLDDNGIVHQLKIWAQSLQAA